MDIDEDYDAGSDDSEAPTGASKSARKKSSQAFTETKAAYVLMNLRAQGNGVKEVPKSLKRRASA
jgi:hypothetical protein